MGSNPARRLLLIRRCLECHQGAQPSGGLSLETHEGLLKGGDSGAVINPESDDHKGGMLLERVKAGEMPPLKRGVSQKLPDAEIAILEKWLQEGALWLDGKKAGSL